MKALLIKMLTFTLNLGSGSFSIRLSAQAAGKHGNIFHCVSTELDMKIISLQRRKLEILMSKIEGMEFICKFEQQRKMFLEKPSLYTI